MNTPRPVFRKFPLPGMNFPWLVCCLLLLAGGLCPAASSARQPGRTDLIWPRPPAPARIRYVQSITSPQDLGIRRSLWGRAADLFTGQDRRALVARPFGVSADREGNLLVADTAANAVLWFDVARRRFQSWEKIGPYRLVSPVAVARHENTFYVADSALIVVLGFDIKGQLRQTLTNRLERPAGLAVVGDQIFVTDSGAHQVVVFDTRGRFLRCFGTRGTGPGEFNFPTHIAADSAGRLLVTDSMNNRVQVLDQSGQSLGVIGSAGDGSGHFSRPKGLAVDEHGHVYVADALFDNIQVFDTSGEFLLHFGQAGQEPGEFWMPGGIAVGGGNRLYVADTFNRRVQVFEYIGQP